MVMDEIFKLINKLEEEHNYEEALEHLEIAFEEKLGSFDIRKDMGRILNKMGKFEDALSCFDIVLSMDDSNPEYLFGRGISLIGLNRFDESLEIFNSLTSLDAENANVWYYKSLLSKSLGDTDAKYYFNKFLSLDNQYFRNQRSYFNFGLLFDEYEHDFRRFYPLDLLMELKEELSFLDPYQYTEIVRIVPLEFLFDKIIELKTVNSGTDTENIIRREFKKQGLSDEDINDLFKIGSVENLKKEVIDLCDEDPFIDEGNNSDFIPLKIASRYNILRRNLLLNNPDLIFFNKGNFYFDYNQYEEAIKNYDEGLKINPDNLLLKFVKCCAVYNLRSGNNG